MNECISKWDIRLLKLGIVFSIVGIILIIYLCLTEGLLWIVEIFS